MSWPRVKLGDVATINPRLPRDAHESQLVTFVAMASASEDGYLLDSEARILSETKKGFTYFDRNDVLLAKITPCFENGKCLRPGQIPTEIGFGSTEFHVIRPASEKLDGLYLFYLVWSEQFRFWGEKSMSGAAGQRRVGSEFLREFEIPLPPLPEQKRIAAILDKADSIRRKRQQAIKLADDFLRAVFLDMFGDPVTNPKGWMVRPLSELVSKLGDGLHGTPKYDELGDYYFINGNNLDSGRVVVNERVKRVGFEEFKRHKKELNENTMLVSINGTIGKIAFYKGEKVVLGKSVCYFNVIPEYISSMYLHCLIGSHHFLRYTGGIETGSTIKNVSLKSMREFPVPVPSVSLQKRFEAVIATIESKKENLSAGHKAADALFDSLSQRVFSAML